jgi:predicted dehydrogenase
MGGEVGHEPMGIGVIGAGKISEQYFESLPLLPGLRLVAVADRDQARATVVARDQGVDALSVDALLADDRIEAILNLTTPESHVEVNERALAAGRHVFAEKPLALAPGEATAMLARADAAGLRIGSAPDTVLGTGIQTARDALDHGLVGSPVGAAVFWHSPGHELWHPNPAFYYQPGAGPLFDMGPYYLTTLVLLLGPVVRVSGVAGRSARPRVVATGDKAGTSIPVDVDTQVVFVLEHASGVSSSVTMSFEVWASRNQRIEVYGTEGTLAVSDPNTFSEPVEAWTTGTGAWETLPVSAGYEGAGRGFGLADMAHAIRTGRPHRASADLAFHVLEIMDAVLRAARDGSVVTVTSTFVRTPLVPKGATPDSW